jgi:hypothetical protein
MQPGPAGQDKGDQAARQNHERALQTVIPSVREHVPSVVWGAILPLGVYFLVRNHVQTDTQALIIAGGFSAAWVTFQFVRRRRVDLVGVVVLSGFVVGVASAELLGGNAYVLKVRDAFFTALFGALCIITVFTHRRPAIFYVGRYLSAGQDPDKMAAYNALHEVPIGRHAFRVLSVVWGIGLIVEAGSRMTLADLLPTGTFLAVSPFVTASVLGSLFAFTVVFVRRAQFETVVSDAAPAPTAGPTQTGGPAAAPGQVFPNEDEADPSSPPS